FFFFFPSRRRHTRSKRDWSSDVCSSDLLAEELRDLLDQAKVRRFIKPKKKILPINKARGELTSLLTVSYPKSRLVDMVLSDELEQQLVRIILEQRHAAEILSHGLQPRRKLL